MIITLNLTPEQVADLKKQGLIPSAKKRRNFKPEKGQDYSYAFKGQAWEVTYNDDSTDRANKLTGNCYETESDAELANAYQEALVRLWDYADEHCNTDIDWSDGEIKYYVHYYTEDSEWLISSTTYLQRNFLMPHFTSIEDGQKLRDNCTAELDIIRAYSNR